MQKNKIIVHTKEGYIHLMAPVTASEYERLTRSIKEEGGLLVPVVLNQNNVVLDGHHRLQVCGAIQDYLTRLIYVVNINFYRRSLNDFQRAKDNKVLG